MRVPFFGLTAALLLSGCGVLSSTKTYNYKIVRVTPENDKDVNGIRFFQPRPYLCVTDNDLIINGVTRRSPILGPDGQARVATGGQMLFTEESEAVIAAGKKNRLFKIRWMADPENVFCITGDISGMPVRMSEGWKLLEFDNKTFFNEQDESNNLIQQINGAQVEPGWYELVYRNGALQGMKRIQVISGT